MQYKQRWELVEYKQRYDMFQIILWDFGVTGEVTFVDTLVFPFENVVVNPILQPWNSTE